MTNDRIKEFFGGWGTDYTHEAGGWGTMEVLHFLRGLPCDDFLLAYLGALRPSRIRIVKHNEPTTCDGMPWRVTIHLDENERVASITQEVEFGRCEPFSCGWEIEQYLKTGEVKLMPKGKDGEVVGISIVNTRGVRR